MKKKSSYFFIAIFPFIFFSSFIIDDSHNFPVPPKTDDLLFYLQRTVNTNTVIYELNKNERGEVNLIEPIKINWIRYADDSTKESLNYIQRTFAYGIETTLIDAQKKSFSFHFVSYEKKELFLLKSAYDNKYHVYIDINGNPSILDNIFVKIEGGTYWFPNIKYVEVKGKSPVTKEGVEEKIKP